jgi:hypothetical protein
MRGLSYLVDASDLPIDDERRHCAFTEAQAFTEPE